MLHMTNVVVPPVGACVGRLISLIGASRSRGMSYFKYIVYGCEERISTSNFMEKNLPPARAKPPVAPPPLYVIHSMGHAKGRGKGRRAKYGGVLEGGATCSPCATSRKGFTSDSTLTP